MRKTLLILLLIIFGTQLTKAQFKEISLNIGDSLSLGKCTDSAQFAHIDIMIKTRTPNPEATFDSISGKGFYNWFFDGDIDSRRLPCSFSGMRFRIASYHTYKNDDGSQRTVIFGQFIDQRTVLWIEIEKAIESGEVLP